MNAYRVEKFLCKGAYGSVHRGTHTPSGARVAIKTMKASAVTTRECDIAQSLHHPNVIETYEVVAPQGSSAVYMVQGCGEGGDLYDFMSKRGPLNQSPRLLKQLVYQMVAGLRYMHEEAGVVHRDIKLENFVLRKPVRGDAVPEVCVIDFGLSQRTADGMVRGQAGTEGYMAPEVACQRGNRDREVDGCKADVFSVGVLIYAMLTCGLPFESMDVATDASYREYLERVQSGCLGAVFSRDPESVGITPELAELLDRMLCPDPAQRCTFAEVLPYFELPWLACELVADLEGPVCLRPQTNTVLLTAQAC